MMTYDQLVANQGKPLRIGTEMIFPSGGILAGNRFTPAPADPLARVRVHRRFMGAALNFWEGELRRFKRALAGQEPFEWLPEVHGEPVSNDARDGVGQLQKRVANAQAVVSDIDRIEAALVRSKERPATPAVPTAPTVVKTGGGEGLPMITINLPAPIVSVVIPPERKPADKRVLRDAQGNITKIIEDE